MAIYNPYDVVSSGLDAAFRTADFFNRQADRAENRQRLDRQETIQSQDRARRIGLEDAALARDLEDRTEKQRLAKKAEARSDLQYNEEREAKALLAVLRRNAEMEANGGKGMDFSVWAQPEMGEWIDSADGLATGQIAPNDPGAMKALKYRMPDSFSRGIGEKTEKDEMRGGVFVPANTEIIDKDPAAVAGNEAQDGLHVALWVTGKTPDGQTIKWPAPRTEGSSAKGDDRKIKTIPLDQVHDLVTTDKILRARVAADPANAKQLIINRAMELGYTSKDWAYTDPKLAERATKAGVEEAEAKVGKVKAETAESMARTRKLDRTPGGTQVDEDGNEITGKPTAFMKDVAFTAASLGISQAEAIEYAKSGPPAKRAEEIAERFMVADPDMKPGDALDRAYGIVTESRKRAQKERTAAQPAPAPKAVTSEAEVSKLPKGTKFTLNGKTYTKN